jgi:hypothetical protein
MGKMWHSAGAMKAFAAGLLALALAGIALAFVANGKWVAIQGPGALQAVAADTLWLGVDEELWVLDAQGHRTARRSARELGFTEAVANIVLAPGQQVLLSSRGDRDWQLVAAATLARVRTVRPQWPEDIAKLPLRAVHLAVSPGGDIAAATGGGHTVILFDKDGRFLARTAPDTYRFTNGLWWSPEGWWTTDTNRFALHLLDAKTLAVTRTVSLRRSPAGYPFLGEATASQGRPLQGSEVAPLATLSRLGTLMEPGHVVDVFANGEQALFNPQPMLQVRDLAWFGGHLLVVDGDAFQMRRFGADRTETAPFGDAQVRSALAGLRADRAFWRELGSRHLWLVAAFLLLAGIVAYARHRWLSTQDVVVTREGTPQPLPEVGAAELAAQRRRLYGMPLAVRIGVVAVALFIVFPLLHWWLIGPRPEPLRSLQLLVFTLCGVLLAVTLWQLWRQQRMASDPELEAALNEPAIAWLRRHTDFDRVKLEAEVARETVYLPGWQPRWLLVTNRRILLFIAGPDERRLASEWPRRAVVFAGAPERLGGQPSWWRRLLKPANLVLTFTTGTTLHLRCASTVTARRVAELLMSSPALPDEFGTIVVPLPVRRRWHEVLASFVLPGTGQWLQGRFTAGTVLFTAALLLALFVWWPVVWALHGPKMEVSTASIVQAIVAWLLIPLIASRDAWRFSATRRR